MGRQPINQIGNTYGKWTVIQKDPQKNSCGQVCWICQCQCGTIKSVSGKVLRRGKSKSCGCNLKQIYIGDIFGKLEVIEEDTIKNNYKYWKCKCDCGNIISVRGTNLTSGNTTSCGHSNNTRLSLLNQSFGMLKVIQDAGKDKTGNSLWKCQCVCGKIKIIRGSNLISGNTISCGCHKTSKGQLKIESILKENNLIYKREYIPKDLSNRRFDFAIFEKDHEMPSLLIQYDGIQHFQEWNLGNDTLAERQQKDEQKNQWAKKNNILLIRIPYWELDNLNKQLLFSSKYLI